MRVKGSRAGVRRAEKASSMGNARILGSRGGGMQGCLGCEVWCEGKRMNCETETARMEGHAEARVIAARCALPAATECLTKCAA